MSCFSCFSSNERRLSKRFGSRKDYKRTRSQASTPVVVSNRSTESDIKEEMMSKVSEDHPAHKTEACNGNMASKIFTFRELAAATKNFRPESLVGEGGFGRVYKGRLTTGQVVAVKQLDRNGFQGNKEFMVEVLMLSLLHHPHLVSLIGYCADGDQRLLVYEFLPRGCLEDHLLDIPADQTPLSWSARMKIAIGAAKGLEYLHEKANPPVIYRDLKSSNILLDDEFNAKLSDFGLAKLASMGDTVQVSSKVMGTYGYCAPEYARTGQLTCKSDVYSFGVVLLELITGRRVIDTMRPQEEQNLVTWAEPMFKDQRRHEELADPLLRRDYPVKSLSQAVAVAAMCIQEDVVVRPMMTDVVTALSFLLTPADQGRSAQSAVLPEPESERRDLSVLHKEVIEDRQRAVQEAIEWGTSSRSSQMFRSEPFV